MPPAPACRRESGDQARKPARRKRMWASCVVILGGDIVGACRLIDGVDDSFVKGPAAMPQSRPAPSSARRSSSSPAFLMRTYGHRALPEHRPTIHTCSDAEHRASGHFVASPDRALNRSGTTPLRQQREMQVVTIPAAAPPAPIHAGSCRRPPPPHIVLRWPSMRRGKHSSAGSHSMTSRPSSRAAIFTGLGIILRPRPVGASGRVSTATTSKCSVSLANIRKEGTAHLRGSREQHS